MHHHTENQDKATPGNMLPHERKAIEKEVRKRIAIEKERTSILNKKINYVLLSSLDASEDDEKVRKDLENLGITNDSDAYKIIEIFKEVVTNYKTVCNKVSYYQNKKFEKNEETESDIAAKFLATKYAMIVKDEEVIKNNAATNEDTKKTKKAAKKRSKAVYRDTVNVLNAAQEDLNNEYAPIEKHLDKMMETCTDKLANTIFPEACEYKKRKALQSKYSKIHEESKKELVSKMAATRRKMLHEFTHEYEEIKNYTRKLVACNDPDLNNIAVYTVHTTKNNAKIVVYGEDIL